MVDEGYTHTMDSEFTPTIKEIGASTNPFQHQTEALKARIFHGASRVEFSFFGQGKTNKEQPGPESFGKTERQDMRELALINEVETSTHATVGIQGLSGFDGQNGFSSEQQQKSLDELKKAIDFASEASTGGAVVFHTGEGPRSMWTTFEKEFQKFDGEEKEEIHYLVDPNDKKISGVVKEDSEMFLPVTKRDENGNKEYLKDEKGELIKDEITDKPIPVFNMTPQGDIETKKYTFSQWKDEQRAEFKKQGKEVNDKQLIKQFFEYQQELGIQYQLGQARQYIGHYKSALKERDKIIDALNYYTDLKDKIPEDEWEKNFAKEMIKSQADQLGYTIPDKSDPVKYLKEKLDDNVREIGYGKEIAVSGVRQAQEAFDKVNRSVFIEDYAVKQSSSQMAKAAVYANSKNEERRRMGDETIAKNPLYISPESWRPEDMGGHPDEMRKLVETAREKVVEELKYTHGEIKARQIAKETIKATLDIGHMNTWKRHFVPEKNETTEHFDKRFKTWMLKKAGKMAEDGIVGHVHLSDNFGYDDEHLTIGQGSAPVNEFVAIMKKHGVNDFIVEAGSHNPLTAMPDAWSQLGSSAYRIEGGAWSGAALDGWGQVHQSYFGKTEGPRYVVGEYAPSEDFRGSPFYSGTPLE